MGLRGAQQASDDLVFRSGSLLTVRRTLRYRCARFALRGTVDASNVEWLAELLVTPSTDPAIDVIAVDLSGVTFFAASGLHCLNSAAARAAACGRWFSIWDPPPFVRRVLDAGGVHPTMLIEPPG